MDLPTRLSYKEALPLVLRESTTEGTTTDGGGTVVSRPLSPDSSLLLNEGGGSFRQPLGLQGGATHP